MSAIAAVLDRNVERPGRPPLVQAMLAAMRHRGPDSAETTQAGPAALGLALLATTPEDEQTTARGPQVADDGRLALVADARLDNREEIIARCGSDPSACDAALLLDAYRRWGTDMAHHLRGDFAILIFDGDRELLYAARDHLGVRPLFYFEDGQRWRFASEMQALFADPEVPKRPNLAAVSLFLVDAYGENDDTLYEGVRALAPAHEMVLTAAGGKIRRYWSPNPWQRLDDERPDAIAEQLFESLARATRARLRTNGPVGVSLSGGLDSSSVAGMAERVRRQGDGPQEPLTALHLVYPGLECDESAYGRAVAELWDLPLITIDAVARADAAEPAPSAQPADVYYAPHHTFFMPLLEAAGQRNIRTTLTGQGGDLLLRGTGVEWADQLRSGRLNDVLRQARSRGSLGSPSTWRTVWAEGVRPLVPSSVRDALRPALRAARRSADGHLSRWAAEVTRREGETRAREAEPPEAFPSHVARAMVSGIVGPAVASHLLRWDRVAARYSQELRHPFLDVEVVELLLAVPHELRHVVGMDKPKPILRRAMSELLPEPVRSRPDSAEYSCYCRLALYGQHHAALRQLFVRSKLVETGVLAPATAAAVARGDESIPLPMMINSTAMEIWLRQLSL